MDEDQAQKESQGGVSSGQILPRDFYFYFILIKFRVSQCGAIQTVVDRFKPETESTSTVNALFPGRQGPLAKPHGHDGNSSNDKRCAGNTNGNSRLG
jgi:hypothetical protein